MRAKHANQHAIRMAVRNRIFVCRMVYDTNEQQQQKIVVYKIYSVCVSVGSVLRLVFFVGVAAVVFIRVTFLHSVAIR